jgi:hypothetical protein
MMSIGAPRHADWQALLEHLRWSIFAGASSLEHLRWSISEAR